MSHPYVDEGWKHMTVEQITGLIREHWAAERWPQVQLWMNRLQARLNQAQVKSAGT